MNEAERVSIMEGEREMTPDEKGQRRGAVLPSTSRFLDWLGRSDDDSTE